VVGPHGRLTRDKPSHFEHSTHKYSLSFDKGLNRMFRSERTGSKSTGANGDEMTDGSSGELVWHRGIGCDGGACVEVATTGDTVMVRRSAQPDGTPVTLSRDEWQEFLAGVKEGALDGM
jgi:predicted secreted Zn-dependent protease